VTEQPEHPQLPAVARRLQEALDDLGVQTRVVITADSARTAEEAALAVGAEVGQIVKSLVFLVDEDPVLVLVSGSNRLDVRKLADLAHGTVERADADTVRAATGYPIGGVAPIVHTRPLPVWCDADLLRYETVWAAAGTPHAVFPVAPGDLVRVTDATVADLRSEA
jgi:prolyl-tRNA editing enzyme YbaK/EbsC (Cys-tRNA(Pro) deacylase)